MLQAQAVNLGVLPGTQCVVHRLANSRV